MKRIAKKKIKKIGEPKIVHSWRLCPAGEHWVRTHPLKTPASKNNPAGGLTTRRGHCAFNPTGKDQLYPDEIQEMAEQNFLKVKEKPCSINLKFKNKGDQYDDFIAGWTRYWNDVFKPKTRLAPNIVKALIASESGFNPTMLADKKNSNSARGLMQILNSTRRNLGDESGELKNHFLTVTKNDLNDPNVNICAGIRWLFQKQLLASSYLGREASWEEAVMNYKGKLKSKTDDAEAIKQKKIFQKYFDLLEKCEKS
ncbi:MAG: lytic transglycosylase domain-containing protein [Bdellovibrionales bacterium]|nr:lytic transglycosylase domain-containing protein [Bdellovibrionales bacterium]